MQKDEWKSLLTSGAQSLGIDLADQQVVSLGRFRDILLEWNRRMNLTAITGDEDVAVKHFLDSLACLQATDVPQGARVIDVGSGAGFPGIPLAIARPDLQVCLLEATRRKVEFLQEAAGAAGVTAEVVWARAEDAAHLSGFREGFDIAVARAVASLPTLVEYCLPFCRRGGRFLAMKAREASVEVEAARRAVSILGGRVDSIYPYELPAGAGERAIVVIVKERSTPGPYPRKAGIPAKRPL